MRRRPLLRSQRQKSDFEAVAADLEMIAEARRESLDAAESALLMHHITRSAGELTGAVLAEHGWTFEEYLDEALQREAAG